MNKTLIALAALFATAMAPAAHACDREDIAEGECARGVRMPGLRQLLPPTVRPSAVAKEQCDHWKLGLFVVLGDRRPRSGRCSGSARARFQRESFAGRHVLRRIGAGARRRARRSSSAASTLGTVSDITHGARPPPRAGHIRTSTSTRVARLGLGAWPKQGEESIDPNLRVQLVVCRHHRRTLPAERLLRPPSAIRRRALPFEPPWNYVPSAPSTLKSVEEAAVELVDNAAGAH